MGTKVWPFTNDYMRNIKDFLNEYYGPRVEFEDWKDDLGDCLEAAKAFKLLSYSLGYMYIRLAEDFSKEKKSLTTLEAAFGAEVEELNREVEELTASIKEKGEMTARWGKWPLLGRILEWKNEWEKQGNEDQLKKWKKAEAQNGVLIGAQCVREQLVPALDNFGKSMLALAGFFDVLRRDLSAISKTGNVVKKRHFTFYKDTAVAISGRVDAFNMIESTVSVTLSSLPEPRTREVMDRAADAWLQSMIDDPETKPKARPLLHAVKAAFSQGKKVATTVASLAFVRGPSDDEAEGPAERASITE